MLSRGAITTIAIVGPLVGGTLGYAIALGSWKGEMSQVIIEHARRLNAQEAHMEAIDQLAYNSENRLSTIEAQLGFLVSRERDREEDRRDRDRRAMDRDGPP